MIKPSFDDYKIHKRQESGALSITGKQKPV